MSYTTTVEAGNTWIIDGYGNRASLAKWETEAEAIASLQTLTGCFRCIDCSLCTNCSDCIGCSTCSGCSGCGRCTESQACLNCTLCNSCSECVECDACSACEHCSGCSRCTQCGGCHGCDNCHRCSECEQCSQCSDCSECFYSHRCQECSLCRCCSGFERTTGTMEAVGLEFMTCRQRDHDERIPVPTIHEIHRAVYAAVVHSHALDMSNWHRYGTTHCRAGWVVHLAGDAGRLLEEKTSTLMSAMLIYGASGTTVPAVRFFATNEAAMADIRSLALEF